MYFVIVFLSAWICSRDIIDDIHFSIFIQNWFFFSNIINISTSDPCNLDVAKKFFHMFRHLTRIQRRHSFGTHCVKKNYFHLLTDHRDAIVFQPTAQARPAHTKTNRRPDDQFRGGSNFFFTQFVPNGCLHWIPGYR